MIQTQAGLNALLDKAAKRDAKLKAIIDELGYPEPRPREHGFATMLRIIVSQQISTQVAAVIWSRIETLFAGDVNAYAVSKIQGDKLKECGLSRQKVTYAQALAERIESGQLSPPSLKEMSDDEAIKTLTEIKGYGIWSAEIYAMFALGRADIFPAGDLALQIAIQRLEGLDQKPDEKHTREIARRWSPYQSAVALLMWKYYGSTTMS